MLIDEQMVLATNHILALVASVNKSGATRKIKKGIYEVGHFGSSNFLPGYAGRPEDLSISAYGVCDNEDQVIEKCPELQDEEREFVITLTRVEKANEPPYGGWRWHKWGPYIGTHKPEHEYLYDEEGIERVFVYHIYERKSE